ncbi:transmembrane protein, putative [Bodo saltans]|uniref:Transmembrane protein, putative n=1 Tax=Bodo saltans TaxID=75058 RepID=A0A0S4JFC6_BODSA|nr:transmembrane protein, putative [Bodo saltans]|eukprot:CUG88982.1 transmembrane protein, putative [Bodo saltans]
MVSIPVTPCNCVSVDSAAVACLLLCCILHLRRQHSRLKLHQLLFPREQSATMQQAADVVITCDVVKLTLGLIVVHGSLFIHEAIVSNGGVNETKYYFLIHMARAFIDIVLVSVIAHVFWMHALVPYVNHLISKKNYGWTPPRLPSHSFARLFSISEFNNAVWWRRQPTTFKMTKKMTQTTLAHNFVVK